MNCKHNKGHQVDAKVACFEDRENGFMLELRISCADCGKPFQFLGLKPGLDMGGATVDLDGLEARMAICPEGARPSPIQRMAFGIRRFDG